MAKRPKRYNKPKAQDVNVRIPFATIVVVFLIVGGIIGGLSFFGYIGKEEYVPPSGAEPDDHKWNWACTSKLLAYTKQYSTGASPSELTTEADLYVFGQDPRTIKPRKTCYSEKDIIYDAISYSQYLPGFSKIDYTSGGVNIIHATDNTASSMLCGWINNGSLKKENGKYILWLLIWDGDNHNDDTSATDPQTFYYHVVKLVEDTHFWELDPDTGAGNTNIVKIEDTDPNPIRLIKTLSIGTCSTSSTTLTWAFDFGTSSEVYDPAGGIGKVRIHVTLASGMTWVSATYDSTSVPFMPVSGYTSSVQQYFDLSDCEDGNLVVTFSGTYAAGSSVQVYIEPEDTPASPVQYQYNTNDPRNTSVGSEIATETD